jgi:hypothetical protein
MPHDYCGFGYQREVDAVSPLLPCCYPAVICCPFPAKRYANQIVTGKRGRKHAVSAARLLLLAPARSPESADFRGSPARFAADSVQKQQNRLPGRRNRGAAMLELDHLMV